MDITATILEKRKRAHGIDDFDLEMPCFRAKLKQKDFSPLGDRQRAVLGDKAESMDVFLLNRSHGKLNPWYETTLRALFTDDAYLAGLRSAYDQYLYGEEWCGGEWLAEQEFMMPDPADRVLFEAEGMIPFLGLSLLILDHEKDLVVFDLWTVADGNLDEHGITIHYQKGEWHFDYSRASELLCDEDGGGSCEEMDPDLVKILSDQAHHSLAIDPSIQAILAAGPPVQESKKRSKLSLIAALMPAKFSPDNQLKHYLTSRIVDCTVLGPSVELLVIQAYLQTLQVPSTMVDHVPACGLDKLNPKNRQPAALVQLLAEQYLFVEHYINGRNETSIGRAKPFGFEQAWNNAMLIQSFWD